MCLIFGHRVCLNVAMVAMVNSSAEMDLLELREELQEDDNHCPVPEMNFNVTLNSKQGTYPWTPYSQGVILASYFYGYVIAQVIGGRISDFVGATRLFGGATLLSSVLTCFTPIISTLSPIYMIVLRVVLGFVHGMNYPSAYTLIARWAPLQERSTLLSVCVIGTHFGVVVSMPLTGYLCEHGFSGGWPSAFYLMGSAGFVWFVFWVFLVFESPAKHPRISTNELAYIQKNIPFVSNDKMWPSSVRLGASSSFQSINYLYLDEVLAHSKKGDAQQWTYIFYISVGMYIFGALVFLIFGSAQVQPWGIFSKEKSRTLSVREANLIFTVPVILTIDDKDLKKDNTTVVEVIGIR
ncbi:vesicular glutamate transporter 1 [Nephila pilipes]|uniref:Vesicular glutamate transporter 1 n=1 Tax=Nephila pilipes TaxID=299642 RepID=A0A8X6MVN8_NEPPI|nr:vesicular glutamate transporter 1 [Nephila pilipes]